jgi:hypothetical protein
MGTARFKSRRSPAPAEETAKVADVVRAYYEAGRRPAEHRFDFPEPAAADAPEDESEDEPDDEPEDEPEHEAHDAEGYMPDIFGDSPVTSDGQSLEELADELEALIESIRYGSVST